MLFILILLICLVSQFFLAWWIIAPIAFLLSSSLGENAKHAFWSGFSALFVLWTCMALLRTLPNENLLANRVAEMLTLPAASYNWIILILISATVGGLVAGFSALAGYHFKQSFKKRRR